VLPEENFREFLLRVIRENPGIHFRELQRLTDSAVGQLQYHLGQLERLEKIYLKKDGRKIRYFTSEGSGYSQRKLIYYLRNRISGRILFQLIERGSVPRNSLIRGREKIRKLIKEKLREMEEDGIIVQVSDSYSLRDREEAIRILRQYKASFLSSLSDNLISLLE